MRKLVNSTGKAQKVSNPRWTTQGGKVTPTEVPGYVGHDVRYQDPDFKGELSKLGPGRYPEDIKLIWSKRGYK